MGYGVQFSNTGVEVQSGKAILSGVSFSVAPGSFVALLGENGAGKTTLLDLVMGFRRPSSGKVTVDGGEPHLDPHERRARWAYLSEKVDISGDWSVSEFLAFNRYFYPSHSMDREKELLQTFRVDPSARVGNLSAGEIRRAQVVAALAIEPELVVVDEITAVLDIVGRRRFLKVLADLNRTTGCTVLLATNILEDLAEVISHVCLVAKGRAHLFQALPDFLGGRPRTEFTELVVGQLERVM